MKHLVIVNLRNNLSRDPQLPDSVNIDQFLTENEVVFGKKSRWIDLSQTDEFEKSREDDRRETLVQDEIPPYIDDKNVYHEATPAVYRIEIHVPDDFTYTVDDITAAIEAAIEDRKLEKKKELTNKVILYVISLIKDWSIVNKMTVLARSDIQVVMKFLDYGSLEQSKTLVENLSIDSVFTQEIKTKLINCIDEKLAEFNAIIWS
jgi:hypothetical protein